MKKTVKRVATLVIVLVMLCTMTAVAFAASTTHTGSFTAIVGTAKYTGTYTEKLNVSTTRASASLSITNYDGIYDSFYAAAIEGNAWATVNGGKEVIGDLKAYGGLSCSDSCGYSDSAYKDIYATCNYRFMFTSLPTQTEYAG